MSKAKGPQSLMDWAQTYGKHGWKVFPLLPMVDGICVCSEGSSCVRPGKHPAIKGWQSTASNDPDQIAEWWVKWPKAGIGIATGQMSNITVLDIDILDEGDVSLNKLKGKEAMPDAPTVLTGSGGFHYYYAYNREVKTTAKKIGKGIDTRNDGGYVVAPPSPHASGNVYQWSTPWKTKLQDFPPWLIVGHAGDEEGDEKGKKAGRQRVERFNPGNPNDVERIKRALAYIDASDYDHWLKIGFILGRAFEWSAAGEEIYLQWAATAGSSYDHKKSKRNYGQESRKRQEGRVLTTAAIYEWARENPEYVPATFNAERAFTVVDNIDDVASVLLQMEAAAATIPNVFARGGDMVKVAQTTEQQGGSTAGWTRDANSTILVPLTNLTLAADLSERMAFIAETEEGKSKRIEIPAKRTQALIDRTYWPQLNQLRGFAPHPIFDREGRIVNAFGYDKPTQMYITREVKVTDGPPITQAQAKVLWKKIMAPLVDFEWETPLDRSIFAAAYFTAGLRYRFSSAPLFGFSAHAPGSGKGLLTDVIGLTWLGARASKIAWSPNPEELEKRLSAYLRAGDPLICFDNVEKGKRFHDPTLCGVLTAPLWDFRILGKSEKVQLPTNATFMATGNDLTATGDTARRTLICRIDPKAEDPSQRQKFEYPDLIGWVRKHRDQMMGASIDIVRGYIEAGKPTNNWAMGSFEEWAMFMDGLLCWLGEASLSQYSARANSSDAESADIERDWLTALSKMAFEEEGTGYTTIELTARIGGSSELTTEFKAAYNLIMHSNLHYNGQNGSHVDVNVTTVGSLMKAIMGQYRQIAFDDNPIMVRVMQVMANSRNKQRRWIMEERKLDAKAEDA